MTTANRIELEVAFGASAPHAACCDCCDGYCPMEDPQDSWQGDTLFSVTSPEGVEYLTNRFVMLRRDVLALEPPLKESNLLALKQKLPWVKAAPEVIPPVSDAKQGPFVLDLCDRHGLSTHESDQPNIVHLYQGDLHVGWTTAALKPPFLTRDDLPLVREIAGKLGMDMGRAAVAYLMAHGQAVS